MVTKIVPPQGTIHEAGAFVKQVAIADDAPRNRDDISLQPLQFPVGL